MFILLEIFLFYYIHQCFIISNGIYLWLIESVKSVKLVLAQECHPRAGGGGDPWLEIKVELSLKSLKIAQINRVSHQGIRRRTFVLWRDRRRHKEKRCQTSDIRCQNKGSTFGGWIFLSRENRLPRTFSWFKFEYSKVRGWVWKEKEIEFLSRRLVHRSLVRRWKF